MASNERKSLTVEDIESQRLTFRLLQPVCSVILTHRDDSYAMLSDLQQLSLLIQQMPSVGLQLCMDYVTLPLFIIVDSISIARKGDKENPVEPAVPAAAKDSVAELCLDTLSTLLSRCACYHSQQPIMLLQHLLPVLQLQRQHVSEEVQVQCVCCVCHVMEHGLLVEEGEGDVMELLRQPEQGPLLGVLLSSLISVAEGEVSLGLKGSKSLRSAALKALSLTIQAVNDAEALSFFLPGVCSGLSKALMAAGSSHGPRVASGAASSSTAAVHALQALTHLIQITLGDDAVADVVVKQPAEDATPTVASALSQLQSMVAARAKCPLEFRTERDSGAGEAGREQQEEQSKVPASSHDFRRGTALRVERNAQWLRMTSSRVCRMMSQVLPQLAHHPSTAVREAVAAAVMRLLDSCTVALVDCHDVLLGVVLQQCRDGWGHIADSAATWLNNKAGDAQQWSTVWPALRALLVDGIPQVSSALQDGEEHAISLWKSLSTAIQVCPPGQLSSLLFNHPVHLHQLCSQLCSCLEFDRAGAGLLVDAAGREPGPHVQRIASSAASTTSIQLPATATSDQQREAALSANGIPVAVGTSMDGGECQLQDSRQDAARDASPAAPPATPEIEDSGQGSRGEGTGVERSIPESGLINQLSSKPESPAQASTMSGSMMHRAVDVSGQYDAESGPMESVRSYDAAAAQLEVDAILQQLGVLDLDAEADRPAELPELSLDTLASQLEGSHISEGRNEAKAEAAAADDETAFTASSTATTHIDTSALPQDSTTSSSSTLPASPTTGPVDRTPAGGHIGDGSDGSTGRECGECSTVSGEVDGGCNDGRGVETVGGREATDDSGVGASGVDGRGSEAGPSGGDGDADESLSNNRTPLSVVVLPRMPLGLLRVSSLAAYNALAVLMRTVGRSAAVADAHQPGHDALRCVVDHVVDVINQRAHEQRDAPSAGGWQGEVSAAVVLLSEMLYGASPAWQVGDGSAGVDGKGGTTAGADGRGELEGLVLMAVQTVVQKNLWCLFTGDSTPGGHVDAHKSQQQQQQHLTLQVGCNALLLRVLLDCIGVCSRALGPRFADNGRIMRCILIPVLEKLGDPCPLVRDAASTCLACVVQHCGYASLCHLLVSNGDYIVDGLCKQMRHLEQHPAAPQLLANVLAVAGVPSALMPIFAEPAGIALRSLSIMSRSKSPEFMLTFLMALRAIMRGAAGEAVEVHQQFSGIKREVMDAFHQLNPPAPLEEEGNVGDGSGEGAARGADVSEIGEFFMDHLAGKDDRSGVDLSEEGVAGEDYKRVELPGSLHDTLDSLRRRNHAAASLASAAVQSASPLLAAQDLQVSLLSCVVCHSALQLLQSTSEVSSAWERELEAAVKPQSLVRPVPPQTPQLLPSIHLVWGPLMVALKDTRVQVVERALGLLAESCIISGGQFLARRFQADAWPQMARLLQHGPTMRLEVSPGEDSAHAAPAVLHRVRCAVLNCCRDICAHTRARVVMKRIATEVAHAALHALQPCHPPHVRQAACEAVRSVGEVDADAVWCLLTQAVALGPVDSSDGRSAAALPPSPDPALLPEAATLLPKSPDPFLQQLATECMGELSQLLHDVSRVTPWYSTLDG